MSIVMDEKLRPCLKTNPDSNPNPNPKPPRPLNSNPNPNPNPPRPLKAHITSRVVPTTRSPPYGATRVIHHKPASSSLRPPGQHRRNYSCNFSLCLMFLFFALIFIFAIALGIFYVVYHPQRPNYSVSSLNFVSFNLTSTNQLTSWLNLTVTAHNPNKRIDFFYDPISISATFDGIRVADGSFPAFVHKTENTTKLKILVEGFSRSINENVAKNLKEKKGLEIKLEMETKVRVKIGGFETRKIGVCISCDRIEAAIPNGKKIISSNYNSNKRCEINLLIQTWSWTF